MAVNPLIPYSDLVTGDPSPRSGGGPVGIGSPTSDDSGFGMSPAMAQLWSNALAPEQETVGTESSVDSVDGDDGRGGSDNHYGVPLDLPPLFGGGQPAVPGSVWRDQVRPDNRPNIDPKNHGGIHEFTSDGHLTAAQKRQRRQALADDERYDQTQAEIAALRKETSRPLPKQDDSTRDGVIEPGWKGGREYESDNFLSRYVKKLRDAWSDNEKTPERKSPPMDPEPYQDYGPQAQEPETVMAPAYGRPPVAPPKFVSDDPLMARHVVETARSMVGQPHRWGGDSFRGADDIGVVRAAYRAAGKDLPRALDPESLPGERVKLSRVRPGDLVTWQDADDPSGNTRVGIALGDGQFVTSSLRRGVSVRNLSDLDGKEASGRRVRRTEDRDDDGGRGRSSGRRGGRPRSNHNYGGGHKGTGRTAAQTRQREGRNRDGSRSRKRKKKSYKGKRRGRG